MLKAAIRIVAVVCLMCWVAACGHPPGQQAGQGGPESVYKGQTLNVLSWEGYQEDEWVKPFEDKYGVKVNVSYAGSVDEMFAKAASGSVHYDLIFMDGGSVTRYQKLNLLQPIDTSKLKNTAQLIPAMNKLNEKHVTFEQKAYALPFAWGSLPLAVNRDKIKEPVDSWSVLWDDKYKGKIATVDDANNQISMTALLLGFKDPYQLTDDQMEQVKQKLIEQKQLVRSYYTGFEDGKNLMASGEAWVIYTQGPTMVTDLQKAGMDVVEVVPKEGALVWIDNVTIGAKAQNPELVHLYIDYLISAEVQAQVVKKAGYGVVNQEAVKHISEKEAKDAHMDDADYFNRLVYVAFPESFEKRVKLWNEVKAN